MLKIIEKTKLWFAVSLLIICIGFGFMAFKGLNYGIDFKGGTIITMEMGKDFDKPKVDEIVKKYAKDFETKKANNTQIEIRSNSITDDQIAQMVKEIKTTYSLEDKSLISQDRIGATAGKELQTKAFVAISVATLMMLVYVGFRFEFRFGVAAIISLVHDVLVTLAVYAIFQVPLNISFIAAMLTIVGYSINDTIVVFDRIRENAKKTRRMSPAELANVSITQTMSRSINTIATTLFTIIAVYAFVPSVRDFSFPLIIGIISGCYSSIFIASPFWVIFKNMSAKKKAAAR